MVDEDNSVKIDLKIVSNISKLTAAIVSTNECLMPS